MRAEGWRKVASATWRGPLDPQIYGDLEIDATELLAFVEEARAATDAHLTVTHLVGRAVAHGLGQNPDLNVRKQGSRFVQREGCPCGARGMVTPTPRHEGGARMAGAHLLAVEPKTIYYAVVVAVLCAGAGYAIGELKGRAVLGAALGLLLGPVGVVAIAVLSRREDGGGVHAPS